MTVRCSQAAICNLAELSERPRKLIRAVQKALLQGGAVKSGVKLPPFSIFRTS
jgi:hypothetical protein